MRLLVENKFYIFCLALNLVYFLFCIAFGNHFYRLGIGPLTISEIIIIISFVYAFSFHKAIMMAFYSRISVVLFGIIALFYFIYSFFNADRDAYFIFRQFSYVFYIAYVPVAGIIIYRLSKESTRIQSAIFAIFLISCLFISMYAKGGNIDGAVTVSLLFFSVFMLNGYLKFLWIAALFLSVVLIREHAAHLLSFIVFFLVLAFFRHKKIIPVIAVSGLLVLLLLSPFLIEHQELNDANALWRFYFWSDIIQYSVNQSWMILGEGYGVPYINPEFEHFGLLIDQIIRDRDSNFQGLTTPPHNLLLNILYSLGLPGVVLFLMIIVPMMLESIKYIDRKLLALWLSSFILILTHNALEFPYMALPVSATFGYVYICNRYRRTQSSMRQGNRVTYKLKYLAEARKIDAYPSNS